MSSDDLDDVIREKLQRQESVQAEPRLPLCARCGKPAQGYATINGERYCHEQAGATCYMKQSWSDALDHKQYADMTHEKRLQYITGLDHETIIRLGGYTIEKADDWLPQCGIAGCTGNHEPQDHNTVNEAHLQVQVAEAIEHIVGIQDDGLWNVAPFRWRDRILHQLDRLEGSNND